MTAHRVFPTRFSGNSDIYKENGGLAAIIQGVAIDHARILIQVAEIPDFTDNSTGVAQAAGFTDVPLPRTGVLNTAAGAASLADLNAALTKLFDAEAVLIANANKARTILGLPLGTAAGGTITTPGTILALTKTVGTATGTSTVALTSAYGALRIAEQNFRSTARMVNEVVYAVGLNEVTDGFTGKWTPTTAVLKAVATASPVGGQAATKTEVDRALNALANNVATMAARWNLAMTQGIGGVGPLRVVAVARR